MYNGYQYFNLYCKVICVCDCEYPHLYNYFKVSSTRKQQKFKKYLLFLTMPVAITSIHIYSLFTLYEGYVIFLLISVFFTWALHLGCIRIIFQWEAILLCTMNSKSSLAVHARVVRFMQQDHRWTDWSSSSLPPSTYCLVEVLMNTEMTICLVQPGEAQKKKKNQYSLLRKIQVFARP